MARYRGIEFAKGYNRSFADFKNEFGSTHVFKRLKPEEREQELKKAYSIATKGNLQNGNAVRTTGKSKKARQQKDK